MPKRKLSIDRREALKAEAAAGAATTGGQCKKSYTTDTGDGHVMMTNKEVSIGVNGKSYHGTLSLPGSGIDKKPLGVILTHGAGGDHRSDQLGYVSECLSQRGHVVLRFTCKGLNIKHRTNVFLGVLRYFFDESAALGVTHCVLAGRSMGSRAAVLAANEIQDDPDLKQFVRGVFCLAYPLHPPKQTSNLRDAPLINLNTPSLFVSGTEDEMATRNIMTKTLANVSNAEIAWLDNIRHDHKAKKGQEDNLKSSICHAIADWIEKI